MSLAARIIKLVNPATGYESEIDLDNLLESERAEWAKVAPEMRNCCVAYLRDQLPAQLLDDVRKAIAEHGDDWISEIYNKKPRMSDPFYIPHVFHMQEGMGVRNLLRDIVKDDELPSGNWDDAYVPCLEEAVQA